MALVVSYAFGCIFFAWFAVKSEAKFTLSNAILGFLQAEAFVICGYFLPRGH